MTDVVDEIPSILIVTSFHLLLYRNGKIIPILKNQKNSLFYGATWNKDSVFVSNRHKLYYIKENCEYEILEPYKGGRIHQIVFYDDFLYVSSTNYNSIDKVDCFGNLDKRIFISYDNKNSDFIDVENMDSRNDLEHINSIFKFDNKFYVAHHNHDEPSFVSLYDKDFNYLTKYDKMGSKIHNIYIEDSKMFVLNSYHQNINYLNFKTKIKEAIVFDFGKIFNENIFLRGLAKSDKYWIVGASTNGNMRNKRDNNPSWILLFDNEFNLVAKINLPYRSQIKEVRVLSEKDYAHNEYKFPGDL